MNSSNAQDRSKNNYPNLLVFFPSIKGAGTPERASRLIDRPRSQATQTFNGPAVGVCLTMTIRQPPTGEILPSAHQVQREYRVRELEDENETIGLGIPSQQTFMDLYCELRGCDKIEIF